MLFVQQGVADKAPTVVGDAMEVNLKQDTYAAALQPGLVMAKHLDLDAAGYQLKVAVRDANSGNTGTVIATTQGLKEIPLPPAPKTP